MFAPEDPQRFWQCVVKTDICWLWTGTIKQPDGYGSVFWGGKVRMAHHISLILDGRPRPDGMETDHLCRVRHCVRPDHLRWVTHGDNVRAIPAELVGTANRHKMVCKYGHDYTPENTRWYRKKDGSMKRDCIECGRRKSKAQWEQKKAARLDA